jgi:hypothetical protein
MRRFKLMAALAVVLAVAAAATLATIGSAKTKDEPLRVAFTTVPLVTNGQPALFILTNLGDQPVTYVTGAADVNGNAIPGSGGKTTCPSLHTCNRLQNFGANQEAISFVCVAGAPTFQLMRMALYYHEGNTGDQALLHPQKYAPLLRGKKQLLKFDS